MTVSEMDEKKSVKVSGTSIASFIDLITDLLVPNVDLDNDKATEEVQNERNEKDRITMVKLDKSKRVRCDCNA